MKQTQPSKWDWNKNGTLIYGSIDFKQKPLVLGFDMDDTLIKTKSGAKFAKDAKDWKWWNEKIISTIQDYSKKGYNIVIFTNQNGIAKGHTKEGDIKQKIEDLQKELKVSLAAYIASDDDQYRKPRVDMWNEFLILNGKDTNIEKSIYCGDAAGRLENKKQGKKKDFSDSDLKFAINVGLIFKTPEQLFLNQDLQEDYAKLIGFNPKTIPKEGSLIKDAQINKLVKPDKPEIIIMTGAPGSGKSTFVLNHLKDYVRVNRDTLKTKEKCLAVAKQALQEKKYVVIDNTNPTVDDREPYIKLAKEFKYPLRSFYLEIPKDLAFHNDTQRAVNTFRKHHSSKVGQIPIHGFYKKVEIPTKQEGFDECLILNFIAGPFDNKEDEQTFYSFVKGK